MYYSLVCSLAIVLIKYSLALVPIIVDTDIGAYPDDVGALSILHTSADQDKIRIRAIVANDRYEGIVPTIEAINRYLNRTDIQIGVTKDQTAYDSGNPFWSQYVIENYAHPMYHRNDEAENAVTVYRRMLATSEDNSIVIVSIGYFNNLANLIESKPDEYSLMPGYELVKTKVNKMVAMAGRFSHGEEWNIQTNVLAARRALHLWPTPIIFVGHEAGKHLFCGKGLLNNKKLANSPITKAWQFTKPEGCFDEIAALISVNRVEPFYSLVYGTIDILPNGTNLWIPSKNNVPTRMSYIKQVVSNQEILDVIDPMLER